MGPYCSFCGTRCFCYFPQETPQHILDAYGTSTIIATCQAGQEFEKKKVGYCYNEILKVIEAAQQCVEPDEGDEPDFTDPAQNPWLLSHEEVDRLIAFHRSR